MSWRTPETDQLRFCLECDAIVYACCKHCKAEGCKADNHHGYPCEQTECMEKD